MSDNIYTYLLGFSAAGSCFFHANKTPHVDFSPILQHRSIAMR